MVDLSGRRIRPEVLAALSQVPEVARVVRAKAARIRDDARALAPVDTGTLRRSIRVERVYDPAAGSVEFRVGWSPEGWYGFLVEAGTEDTAPRPHLRPAARKNGAVGGSG